MDWTELLAATLGILIGVAGDRSLIAIGRKRSVKQMQRAGDFASQTQVGGNYTGRKDDATG
ncbi:hypothetical protein O7631_21005 [Micromonospora sp. WMMD967]|uniref:hypothetical protein n=1 Tax=Micromonospora sp. WMMD967 TaxID=3016101 RepID=UPI002416EF74|nr:hypothetical protein [Micromonospora sp. WMMD967]MDG4839003.1 hypothetical protein [Micromonospora sp. WMMD967]